MEEALRDMNDMGIGVYFEKDLGVEDGDPDTTGALGERAETGVLLGRVNVTLAEIESIGSALRDEVGVTV